MKASAWEAGGRTSGLMFATVGAGGRRLMTRWTSKPWIEGMLRPLDSHSWVLYSMNTGTGTTLGRNLIAP